MESQIEGKQKDRDLPALRTLSTRPSMEMIIEGVNGVMGNQAGLSEKASIYLCHKYSGVKLKEIGERFGKSQSAVTQASRRFSQMIGKDGNLKKLVEQLERTMKLSYV